MSIYAHAPEHHIQHHSTAETTMGTESEEQMPPTAAETESPKDIAPATAAETESTETPTGATSTAESSMPLCDTFGEESSEAATDGTTEHTSCPATPPTETNLGKINLPVGESLFGLVIVTPFLLHFLKRKFSL